MTTGTWSPPTPAAPTRRQTVISYLTGSGEGTLSSVSAQIGGGFDFRVFTSLQDVLATTQAELAELLQISESTLYRRRRTGSFDPPESDRIWRFIQLYAEAVEVLEDREPALAWLRAPLPALGGISPLLAARDSAGAQRALAVLGRIEHGVFG